MTILRTDESTSAQPPAMERRRALLAPTGVAAASALVLTAIAARNPYAASSFPTCPLHAATGLDCPGCGATRGLYELMHGDVIAMADNNLLLLLAVPFLLWRYVRWTALRAGAVAPRTTLAAPWVLIAFAALVVVYGVVRNLPGVPFLPAGLG
jgi:hypothetical protein